MLTEGYKVQGRTKEAAMRLIQDAKALEEAGVFCIVFEMVSHQVAKLITESVKVPTIGIGSGVDCDGQVLVIQDLLGMYEKINPKFVKKYLNLSQDIVNAVKNYKQDIETKQFPAKENMFSMDEAELEKLKKEIEE